jgi:hypothetical protein
MEGKKLTEEEIKNSSLFKLMIRQVEKSEEKLIQLIADEFEKSPKETWTKAELIMVLKLFKASI